MFPSASVTSKVIFVYLRKKSEMNQMRNEINNEDIPVIKLSSTLLFDMTTLKDIQTKSVDELY